ncbi:hypothetical protein KU406_23670, partial [Salmonella enterica subsp. enterica serovar Montevideo]|nr:hypothetical protein [Salmonella enterica subsp. enterica serovar Montevideo]
YKLDTVVVPTNRPMIRKDLPDLVYMTEAEKIQAIIEDIKERTTTRHVGSDSDRRWITSLRNDACFVGVEFCVQDVMFDARFG